MRSIIKYIGIKNINLKDYDIDSYKTYCEPFGGSFNTGMRLLNQGFNGKVVYNDLDSLIVDFWTAVKTNSNKLYDELEKIINCDIDEIKQLLISDNLYTRAAAQYIYCEYTTLNGLKKRKIDLQESNIDLYLGNIMLNRVTSEIYNKDYKHIMRLYNDESTFMFIDPPYICNSKEKYYRKTDIIHEELCDILKVSKFKWLLTYGFNEYILKMYKDFNIREKRRTVCAREYTELYITNI